MSWPMPRSWRAWSPMACSCRSPIAYAVGAVRILRFGALVQQANAIESLSHVDVLCLDKTGTLTANRLEVEAVAGIGGATDDEVGRALGALAASASSRNRTAEAVADRWPVAAPAARGRGPVLVRPQVERGRVRRRAAGPGHARPGRVRRTRPSCARSWSGARTASPRPGRTSRRPRPRGRVVGCGCCSSRPTLRQPRCRRMTTRLRRRCRRGCGRWASWRSRISCATRRRPPCARSGRPAWRSRSSQATIRRPWRRSPARPGWATWPPTPAPSSMRSTTTRSAAWPTRRPCSDASRPRRRSGWSMRCGRVATTWR